MKKRNSSRKITKANYCDTNSIHVYSNDQNISPKEPIRPTYSHVQQTSHESIKKESKSKKKIFIIIGIIAGILIIGGIVAFFVFKKNSDEEEDSYDELPEIIEENIENPIDPVQPDPNHIPVEFEFKTEVKDLKSINVKQKYSEKVLTNGVESTINVFRNTNYEIFFLSSKNSTETNKNNYNKLFTAAMLINSQCVSLTEENCTPKKMIDITKVKKDDIKSSLRYLDELPDFKDLPVPLCLFDITDNNVITSMTCPEKLQTSIKQNMFLDLYFFRPPAIKRPDKNGGKLDKWEEGEIYHIRESKEGICDISYAFNSFCTTDMNTTVDKNGTLLTYDEETVTNIKKDDENSFHKIKKSNLIDKSKDLENVDKISYEEVLNNIISKLNPYMIYNEKFSDESFQELYNLSKNISNDNTSNLENEKKTVVIEENLMNIVNFAGVNVKLNMKNDIGLNTGSMKALLNIFVDDSKKEISNLNEYSNIGDILNKLIILSKSGNEMLLELYNKINEYLEKITTTVSSNITNLINIVVYNDLSEIFESTLSIENIMNLPNTILAESSSLKSSLETLLTNITNEGMKNNIDTLNTSIKDYIERSHILVNNINENINNLTQSLKSPRSKLTEISAFFSNNTPFSLEKVFDEAEEILTNYYKTEKNLISQKIQELLNLFETKTKESIAKEEEIISDLHSKLENNEIKIENEEDLNNLKTEISTIKNSINEIISKGKEKIQNELELKENGFFISNDDININNATFAQSLEGKATKLQHENSIDKLFIKSMNDFKKNFTNILKQMDNIKNEQFQINDDVLNESFINEVKNAFDLTDIENEKNFDEITQEFLSENKNYLNEIFLKLSLLFSEDSLKNLAENLKSQFEEYLNQIETNIETNENVTNEYLTSISNVLNNDNLIFEYLKNEFSNLKNFSKSVTQKFISKFEYFKNNLFDSLNFIEKNLFVEVKNEYQTQINKIKESLNKIKNTKIENKIFQTNEFYEKLNKHFSSEIFDDFYSNEINKFKTIEINKLNNFNANVIEFNQQLKNFSVVNDYQNDFCVNFLRKKTFLNGEIFSLETNSECFSLFKNNENLTKISNFKPKFAIKNFLSELNSIVNDFDSKIKILEEKLQKNDSIDFQEKIQNIKNKVEKILHENFGENLIKNTHQHFKQTTKEKLTNIFADLNSKLVDLFSTIKNDLSENNFKYSTSEFKYKIQIIQQLYLKNVSNSFYDSIISFQKNEFNNTIIFYYDYLQKKINETFKNISSADLNLNSTFSEITETLLNSKNSALDQNSQIYALQIPLSNFFETNSILVNSQISLNNSLTNILQGISSNGVYNDELALALKFYLENAEHAEQIDDFYEEIDKENFVHFGFEKFKEKVFQNLNLDDFVEKLNQTLRNSNFEIAKEFELEKKKYESKLNEILNFTHDEIVHEINDLFALDFSQSEIDKIKRNVRNVVETVTKNLENEQEKIQTQNFNKDFAKINKTINDFKNKIFLTLNQTIFGFFEETHVETYQNRLENNLNSFQENVENGIENFEPSQISNATFDIKNAISEIANDLNANFKFISKSQINDQYKKLPQKILDQFELDFINQEINSRFEVFFSSLAKFAKDENSISYDLSEDIKNEIENSLTINNNEIDAIVQKTKKNFDENNFKNFDFSNTNSKLNEIKENFDNFITKQLIFAQIEIDDFLQKKTQSNFEFLFDDLIPNFGEFFDRVIFYNEKLKIDFLFNNLIYSLLDSLSYYVTLLNMNSNLVKSLTNDLKTKICDLNDLDEIIKKKNEKILNFLNTKIEIFSNEFLTEIQNFYSNDSIKSLFNENILNSIKKNSIFNSENYKISLKNFFNEKILEPYKNVLNSKSQEKLEIIRTQKNFIKERFEGFFSSEPDDILIDINIKLNNTKIAIKNYNDFFNSFKFNQNLINFIENFGKNKIKNLFENFSNFWNENTKNQILMKINENSKNYENSYKKDPVLNHIKNSLNNIKNNFIFLNNSIKNYHNNFEQNLNQKISNENFSEKKNDKSFYITLNEILTKSNNSNSFIKTFEKFSEFEQNLQKNLQNLNSSFKISKNLIKTNQKEFLSNKLEQLKTLASNYYNQINENYLQLKNYLKFSMQQINDFLHSCANETISTFNKKVNEISILTQNKNIDFEEETNDNFFVQSNNEYYTNVSITNLKKKSNLKFSFDFDEIDNLKIPKIYAHVVNLNLPKKINLKIFSNLDTCVKNVDEYEIEFNNVNYTLILDFNSDSYDVVTTVVTDFEAFQISEERYLLGSVNEQNNCNENGSFVFCVNDSCGNNLKEEILPKIVKNVDKKFYSNVVRIPY